MRHPSLRLPLLALLLLLTTTLLSAQGTAFSYQGRLSDNQEPANGHYDFVFTVYDAEADGNPVGQPAAIDALAVTAGQFSTPVDCGAGVFTGAPRWLQISVRQTGAAEAPTVLAPRSPLRPAPYAIHAATAASVPSGTVTATELSTGATPPAAGQILAFDGASLVWRDPATAAGGVFSLNGTSAYYNGGYVGIGTTTPASPVTVQTEPGRYGFEHTDGARRLNTYVSASGGWIGTRSADPLNLYVRDGGAALTIHTNGHVGINTTIPLNNQLEIVGQAALGLIGYQPFLTIYDDSAGYARSRIQGANGELVLATEAYLNGSNPYGFVVLKNSGNVGIGSAQPEGKLEIVAQDAIRMIGYQPFLTFYDSAAGYARTRIQGVNGELVLATETYLNGSNPLGFAVFKASGNLGLGVAEPQAKLDVNGTTRTKVLTITGGADLAEPFRMSDPEIPAGAVVVIDKERPGRLKVSADPYDKKVAGIVSGANGVQPGITLRQEGLVEGDRNVTLSGRVYVQADAEAAPIEPGDLLTSSSRPGHAMKVSDPQRAQGAILGKAMTALDRGQGFVLVLVTLQ